MIETAVIGGTGVYDPEILNNARQETIATDYGTVQLNVGEYQGRQVAFLARHGQDHSIPPHLVNYRANIAALKKLGVRSIFATAAVGSLNLNMKPGQFVFADQFLDFTKMRAHTFFGVSKKGVIHIDMTEPYCPELRKILAQAAEKLGYEAHTGGTYVCAEGPRFETPAEIKMYRHLGGDLVGMTSVPEVTLAREAEICYATIAVVTNFAAGISPDRLSHSEVVEAMEEYSERLRKLIMQSINMLDKERNCICHRALSWPEEKRR